MLHETILVNTFSIPEKNRLKKISNFYCVFYIKYENCII